MTFQIADVFLPAAEALRIAFSTSDELEGTVRGFSDSGSTPCAFALVEVIYAHTLIVPVEKLKALRQIWT